MKIRVNLNRNFNEGDTIVLYDKRRGTIIFNNCEGDFNILVNDELGNLNYLGESENSVHKDITIEYNNANQISNYLSKYLRIGDIIRIDYKPTKYFKELWCLLVIEDFYYELDRVDILIKYNYTNRDGTNVSEYISVLPTEGIEMISLATPEELKLIK